MPRFHTFAVAVCALLLLSGGGVRSPRLAPGAQLAPSSPSARVTARIAELNPHLTPGQLERIEAAVHRYSAKYGLDPILVAAVIEVESSGRPWARSPKGALGLMQVMPYMIRPMGMAGNPSTVEANIEAGCAILAGNIRRLGEADGISAYFWGSVIRGPGYLQRVQIARERLRGEFES